MLLGAHLLFVVAILVLGWPIYPRLFILMLPVSLLAILGALDGVNRQLTGWMGPRGRTLTMGVACLALVLGFALLLRPVLLKPMQAYRAALEEAWNRIGPSDVVLVVGTADHVIGHYARRDPRWAGGLVYARSLGEFDAALTGAGSSRVFLLSTFNAAMAAESPAVWARMVEGWAVVWERSGRVRGGALTLWAPGPPDPGTDPGSR